MKKRLLKINLILLPLLLILSTLTSCLPSDPIYTTGTVTATIPTPVPVIQSVVADPHNSSVANLNAGATFTGTITSSLGIVGIQVSLKTDQDCTVYVDQSPDAVPNWDITDSYSYISSLGGASWTVQAVNSYLRVRVKNTSTVNTTYLRLQTALCPIVEAVPRSLNSSGRFKTDSTLSDGYGFGVENTPMGEMRVVNPVKLVGATFIGTVIDPNFWSRYEATGATITQTGGILTLATNPAGTTANGNAMFTSIRRARYVAGSGMRFRAVIQPQAGTADNIRRWGIGDYSTAPTVTDGAYFKYNGTAFSVATLKGGAETLVSSGSFNGDLGASYTPSTDAMTYEIYWTNTRVWFVIGDKVLHTVSALASTWTNTSTLYLLATNTNSNGYDGNITLKIRAFSIYRLGELQTSPTYRHISGAATTTVCKYGAGILHSVILNNPTNNAITIYDNTAASGNVIAIINPDSSATPFELTYNMDFSTGLTIVTAGSPDLTVVYE